MLSLTVIGENFVPFLLLAIIGIVWNIVAFVYLAPRMIPENWFERGIGDLGQSMGMTAAGLMLIRIADSKGKTKAQPYLY
jgi:ESS family glutamate:Na+ symporter